MNRIEYIESDEKDLDTIGALWEKLNEHHRVNSKYFPQRYIKLNFNDRKEVFAQKSKSGEIRIDLARDTVRNQFIGYCVSSITGKQEGEIDSIYVEKDYRGMGIGNRFMRKALAWMDAWPVAVKKVVIAAGNERAIDFYSRYGFFPMFTTAVQIQNVSREPSP